MYKALYRKWRPRTFDDVVGQEHITTTLKNEVAAAHPSHAYLFCGTRGTGKTSCSKILAKAVNCPNQQDGNPCNACEICKGIDDDSILDVTEIDAASNSGVDNIRDLREEANFTPTVAKYRVYIIDETHMLSTGAFNALLKIMEEPPPHVLFILATTEIHKVPATIMSRCQRFDFRRIASEVIKDRLLYIAREENVTLDEDAALLIARLSDGGMRDALSLLDLCLTAHDVVTNDAVIECAGLVLSDELFEIADRITQHNSAKTLGVVDSLWIKSVDYQRLCEQLIGFYRNLMIAKTVANPDDLIACLPSELDRYKKMANDTKLDDIFGILAILGDTLARMSKTSQRRTELEMGLIKASQAPTKQHSAPKPAAENAEANAQDNTQSNAQLNALLAKVESLEKQLKSGAISSPTAAAKPTKQPDPPPSAEEIKKTPVDFFTDWQDVLEILKDKNAALHGSLINSKAYVGGDIFLVDAGDTMFATLVKTDGYAKESLRNAVTQVTGKKYRLGSYNAEHYEIKKSKRDVLEEILKKADASGVSLDVK